MLSGDAPHPMVENVDMSDPLEMDFRNYHFELTDFRGGGVRIEIKGKGRYTVVSDARAQIGDI